MTSEVLEVTTFMLAGHSGADFIAANADINDYLGRQPGFRWRRIAQSGDGTIMDVVAFGSAEQAEASAMGIMTQMRSSPVHAMIDQSTVHWQIIPVLQVTPLPERRP